MIAAVYEYRDSGGAVVGKVERIEPGRCGRSKDFHVYRFESGTFKPGLGGKALPLYRSDELAQAIIDELTVFLGEGEGKVDVLREAVHEAGFHAAGTTIQGGANAQLRDEHLAALMGAPRFVILADSDEPGRKCARVRADVIARRYPDVVVKIIDFFPDRDDGSDVADWITDGHTQRDLMAIVDAAPKYRAESFEDQERNAVTNGKRRSGVPRANLIDLRDVPFERVRWFEHNMIPRAEFTLVNGDGGIGKTTFVLDLIARASARRPMPSGLLHEKPLGCLIIAEEDRHGLLRARLDVAGADFENIRLFESVGDDREFAVFPSHTETLRRTIEEGGFDLVLIDAFLNHFADDLNASKPQDMRRVCRPLSTVAHETGATVVGIRHFGKAAAMASSRGLGSIEARNVSRSELAVAPHPDDDAHPGLVVVAISKANLAEDRSATMAYRLTSVEVTDDDGEPTTIARVDWEAVPPIITADELTNRPEDGEKSKIDAAVDWLSDHLGIDRHRASEVCEAGKKAGHSQATLYRARKKAGVTTETRDFPAKAYWSIKEPLVSPAFCNGRLDKADKPANPDDVRRGVVDEPQETADALFAYASERIKPVEAVVKPDQERIL